MSVILGRHGLSTQSNCFSCSVTPLDTYNCWRRCRAVTYLPSRIFTRTHLSVKCDAWAIERFFWIFLYFRLHPNQRVWIHTLKVYRYRFRRFFSLSVPTTFRDTRVTSAIYTGCPVRIYPLRQYLLK